MQTAIFLLCFLVSLSASLQCGDIKEDLKNKDATQKVQQLIVEVNNEFKEGKLKAADLDARLANATLTDKTIENLVCHLREILKGSSDPKFGYVTCAGCKAMFYGIRLSGKIVPAVDVGSKVVSLLKTVISDICSFIILPPVSTFCSEYQNAANLALTAAEAQIKEDGGEIRPAAICDRISILSPGVVC